MIRGFNRQGDKASVRFMVKIIYLKCIKKKLRKERDLEDLERVELVKDVCAM